MDSISDELRKSLNDICGEIGQCAKSLEETAYGDGDMTARGNAKRIQSRLWRISGRLGKIIGDEEPEVATKLKFKPGDKVRLKIKPDTERSFGYRYDQCKGEVLAWRESLEEFDHWIKVKKKPPVRVWEGELELLN